MKKTDLGTDSILSLVFKLAIPAMMAQFVNVLYNIIDRIFIGNIPIIGDTALAGIGVCGPIVTLLTSFGTLVGIGGSVYMATKMGEGDNETAEKILSNSFSLLVAMSAILTVLFLFTKEYLLNWFGASLETFVYANEYLTIYTIGTIFAILAFGMNFFITCQGFPTIAMYSVMIGAVINIVLDYLFVVIFDFKVAGAAWATVIAQICSCIWVLLFLFGNRARIRIKKYPASKEIMVKICKMGISPFIVISTDSIILIVLNMVLQYHGGKELGDLLVSAATIVQSYMLIITAPLIGITTGTQAIISYNYGAKNRDRVMKAIKYIMTMAVAFCSIMFVISRVAPQYFVLLFTQNQELVELAKWCIQASTLGIIVMAIQYEVVDAMTALGKTKLSLALSLSRKISYTVLTCVIPIFFIPNKTFYAETISDIACGTINFFIFIYVLKKMPFDKPTEIS